MANLKHDATVGRLLIIDSANPPDITAEEFLSYMDEGFVPILKSEGNNHQTIYTLPQWAYEPSVGVSIGDPTSGIELLFDINGASGSTPTSGSGSL